MLSDIEKDALEDIRDNIAAFGGDPLAIYTTRLDELQSRDIGLKGASLLSVSSKGNLAVSLDHKFIFSNAACGFVAPIARKTVSSALLRRAPRGRFSAQASAASGSLLDQPRSA